MEKSIVNEVVSALAVANKTRTPLLPDVPTLAEAGVPDAEANTFFGLVAPAGTVIAGGFMLAACSATMPSLDFLKSAPQSEMLAIESEPPGALRPHPVDAERCQRQKATREPSRVAFETNCRSEPVPFAVLKY